MIHFSSLAEAVAYCEEQRMIAEVMAEHEAENQVKWMDMHQTDIDNGGGWDE